MTDKFKNLLVRTASGAVFVVLVVGSFFVPAVFQYLLFLFFAEVATWEYCHICNQNGLQLNTPMCLCNTWIILTFGFFEWAFETFWIVIALSMILLPIIELFRKSEKPFTNIAHNFLPIFWIALPFSLASLVTRIVDMGPAVLSIFILIWASDTFAYCGGSLFGKHKLFERISPKKTWEGIIVGAICTCALAAGLSFIPYFSLALNTDVAAHSIADIVIWIGFALLIVVFGTFGDLVESMFKRSYNIKDSGKIMPGHGGALDRFDSFLFAMPISVLYFILLTLI